MSERPCIAEETKEFLIQLLGERKERFNKIIDEALKIDKELLPQLEVTLQQITKTPLCPEKRLRVLSARLPEEAKRARAMMTLRTFAEEQKEREKKLG